MNRMIKTRLSMQEVEQLSYLHKKTLFTYFTFHFIGPRALANAGNLIVTLLGTIKCLLRNPDSLNIKATTFSTTAGTITFTAQNFRHYFAPA